MKKLIFVIIIAALGVAVSAGLLFTYFTAGGTWPAPVVRQAVKQLSPAGADLELLAELLGFNGPRTYLVLLLNNTELRPGGGFIGSYALVEVAGGRPRLIKVEGTEVLYAQARQTGRYEGLPRPPEPLAQYLKINRWGFRDSNWSPDFAESASTSLFLYAKEGGSQVEAIDLVVGVTGTVAEEILKLTGPVRLGADTFTAENVIERVEYAVEYGYKKEGKSFIERKQLLAELLPVVLKQVTRGLLTKRRAYQDMAARLLEEKHLALYAVEPSLERRLEAAGWAGRARPAGPDDYLLWVDANLGALKTDWAIKRELSYQMGVTSSGKFTATAAMRYQHTAPRDWRTSRYQTFARVFVPAGSRLLAVEGGALDNILPIKTVAQGEEGGRPWFGAWFSIAPNQSGVLQFSYEVAGAVASQIQSGQYQLLVDKQIGAGAYPLTLGLRFDKKITFAGPPEAAAKHRDTRYDVITDLRINRDFIVRFEK